MSRYRLVWVKCPDCGRSGERPGGCIVVQRKGWFLWCDFLTHYDRDGSQMASHFRSQMAAIAALTQALAPQPPQFVVVKEIEL